MCNLGKIDRIIRVVIGLALIATAVVTQMYWIGGIGIVALGTSALSFCPLYSILKLNTGCKAKV